MGSIGISVMHLFQRVRQGVNSIFWRRSSLAEEAGFPRILKIRALLACGLLMLAFALLVVRLFVLQVISEEPEPSYVKKTRSTKPMRAEIRDREGNPLAVSYIGEDTSVSITLDWDTLKSRRKQRGQDYAMTTLLELGSILDFEDVRLERLIQQIHQKEKATQKPVYSVMVAERIPPAKTRLVKAYCRHYKPIRGALWRRCITFTHHPGRFYTFRADGGNAHGWAGCLRGFIGTVDAYENGMTGIESAFNAVLEGRPGQYEELRGAKGLLRHSVPEGVGVEPIHPCHVYLTADTRLQKILWEAMNAGLDECLGLRASGLIMDVRDGAILAFGQVSRFPGMHPVFGVSSQFDPLLGYYEPGSIFKPLVAVQALYEGAVKLNGPVLWKGGLSRKSPYRRQLVWDVGSGLHELTFEKGLIRSSNIVLSIVGEKLGGPRMLSMLRRFDIEAVPQVVDQLWPRQVKDGETVSRRKKRKTIKKHDVVSMSYGYAVQTTLLVLARAYCEILNDGLRLTPHVLYGTQRVDGAFKRSQSRRGACFFPDAEKGARVCRDVQDLLRQAVQTKGGTGHALWLRDKSLSFGGKTGTAKRVVNGSYSTTFYTSSFIGFTPVVDPRYVIAVKVDIDRNSSKKLYESARKGVYYGGSTAGPIAWHVINALHRIRPQS